MRFLDNFTLSGPWHSMDEMWEYFKLHVIWLPGNCQLLDSFDHTHHQVVVNNWSESFSHECMVPNYIIMPQRSVTNRFIYSTSALPPVINLYNYNHNLNFDRSSSASTLAN